MEISKSLQAEILAVQNKLKNAIRDHQICVGKLKDDPNNTDILGQIQKIHLHIVSLGRCQKQVVQRLRKEVETFKAENANGAKVSIASLLGLNNNNHITNNNETKLKTAGNNFNAKKSKEDYEEVVRNGDVPSPAQDDGIPTKERSSSVETISGEDDVIEVSMDENSNEKSEKEESEKECKVETFEKINFLSALGLITTVTCAELQNRRAERKRRSTANPQFVYSSLDVPTKRKRHSYLQSGNVPQTRQTTARMNGPSPPPVKVLPPKSTSPPSSKAVMKSLIPVQKSTTRPNILRNVTESKVFTNKVKAENGPSQIQLPVPTVKSVQSIGNKAVHIPGLPSSLTIERISNDSAVCITCRNPGTLTVCENCASNYHVSCHSISPAPPRICPKCALIEEEEIDDGEEGEEEEEEEGRPSFKKSEEFATTSHASGIIRKTREDSEIYKASCGLHKSDAAQKKRGFSNAIGIGQLPSSTFLIPISSNSVSSSTVNQSDVGPSSTVNTEQRESAVSYSSIVLNQLPRSSIAYVDRAEPQVSYAYQLPVSSVQSEKHQSYLIVKKITEPARRASQSSEDQSHTAMLNYKLPTTSGYNSRLQTEISVAHSSMFVGKQLPDAVSRNRKKQTNRAVPALNRIIDTENLSITAEYQLERSPFNGRKSKARQSRSKFGINQLRSARATEILLPSYDSGESDKQLQITKSTEPEEATVFSSRPKYRSRTGGLLHSLFAGHNKSYIVTDNPRDLRDFGAADKDSIIGRQQLYQDYQLESNERNESPVQLQRGALTKFFEHVKLEEAHIPAPSRAKLVYKSGNASEKNELDISETADEDTNSEFVTRTHTSSCNFEDNFTDREVKQTSWLSNRSAAKKGQKKDNATKSDTFDSTSSSLTRAADVITYERKRGNTYIRVECEPDHDEEDSTLSGTCQNDTNYSRRIASFAEIVSSNRRDRHESASLCNAQSNFLELRNEVSVPDDKADTERQDLSSGRRSTSSSSVSSTSDSDTPEQAMNDTINYSRRRLSGNGYKERLGINAVSPESMQVLEQFESAMLETDCSNAATS
ncbi:uncharacterized protein LOC128887468 [Hylaeus anthracinus]|uniref:uncharacterized protein LOC128887468 n=1 Tax=Hylaeus anthracinus TaxID=313031 RepID=UPI0023B983C0|nr:uncharacterized protein LOC128887468 [Hylaeus anthracinus]